MHYTIALALTLGAAALAWTAGRLLWDLDHVRPPGRRRANASLRVGIGATAVLSIGLFGLWLRPLLLPIVADDYPWLDLLTDAGAELCSRTLSALLFGAFLLVVRGIRAILYPQASGDYDGVPTPPKTALVLLVLLALCALTVAAAK